MRGDDRNNDPWKSVKEEPGLLDHTFIHVQGVGAKSERTIWSRGIHTWADFLECPQCVLSEAKDRLVREELKSSIVHRHEVRFFVDRLPSCETWRLYESFKEKVIFLDIETSGGYMGADEITMIGTYDGRTVRSFVSGANLQEFECYVEGYDLVVTFNGTCFDLPFIRRSFPNITLPPAHIDLRFPLKRLGYCGGLKKIERETGIERNEGIRGLDGFDAVKLWRAYQWGDDRALEVLLEYNSADVINLQPLMELVSGELKARMLPFRV